MKKLVSLMSVLLLVGCGSGGSAGGLTIVPVDTGSTPPVYTSVNNFNIEQKNEIKKVDNNIKNKTKLREAIEAGTHCTKRNS